MQINAEKKEASKERFEKDDYRHMSAGKILRTMRGITSCFTNKSKSIKMNPY